MAVLTQEEFLKALNERIGEDTSDEALKFVEDATDTLNAFNETKESENWKTKYDQLDTDWRKRYKERFFKTQETPENVKEEQEDNVKEDGEKKDYSELFQKREG